MFDNLNNALDKIDSYEGVYFLGKVVDAEDPLNLNRIRAKVVDLYEGANDLIPWAIPIKPNSIGESDTTGVYGSPPVGSNVLIILQKGNPHYPLYMSIQTKANADFPNGTWGFSDKYQNKLTVGPDGIELTTACGALFKIDSSCKITMTAPGGFEFNGDSVFNGNQTINGDQTLSGSTTIGGSVTASGDVVGAGRSLSSHIHAVLSKDFGITSPPF